MLTENLKIFNPRLAEFVIASAQEERKKFPFRTNLKPIVLASPDNWRITIPPQVNNDSISRLAFTITRDDIHNLLTSITIASRSPSKQELEDRRVLDSMGDTFERFSIMDMCQRSLDAVERSRREERESVMCACENILEYMKGKKAVERAELGLKRKRE